MWYIHTMQYYSATKRTEVLIHAKTWINLKNGYAKSKHNTETKCNTKGHIFYDSIRMKCPQQANQIHKDRK